jgi:Flp pilus assembly pilin Flp
MTSFRNAIALRLALALQGDIVSSLKREDGQTLAEYALILAFIAVVVVTIVITLGGTISGLFSSANSAI